MLYGIRYLLKEPDRIGWIAWGGWRPESSIVINGRTYYNFVSPDLNEAHMRMNEMQMQYRNLVQYSVEEYYE